LNSLDKNKTPIAIVGMGCIFPQSADLKAYWQLLFHGKDAITDIPESHWSAADYFHDDPKKPDHVYCKRGGFISPVAFDPTEFGIPPANLEATDTSQLLGLVTAQRALEDSGYKNSKTFNREKTSVILGVTGTQELVIPLGARLGHPLWRNALENSGVDPEKTEQVIQRISDSYVSWQENSFPGLLGNVVAGRISNRLDLGGTNCVVDAACASSMSAIHLAVLELLSGRSDTVITGGVDMLNDIFMHMCFAKTGVLSPTGDIRPFSKDADGTILGEGIGLFVLKRLEDAQRNNDRIYAVIKGMGSSSDGKSQSIYAPRAEGQLQALQTAYSEAGIDPATVELIEAHGTGTRVGDVVEFQALNRLFGKTDKHANRCALGSVKSMIGHTKAAAGAAGLMKVVLAIYHKILPPTLKIDEPDPKLNIDKSPFYLNTATRPWFSKKEHPRRTGVSAFGFGGSNFHMVLEEYDQDKPVVAWDGSVDIVALSAATPKKLTELFDSFKALVDSGASSKEIALTAARTRKDFSSSDHHRLVVVLEQSMDLSDLFNSASQALESNGTANSWHAKNVFYGNSEAGGKIAFIFPGQGSQYTGMGRDFVCFFPEAFNVLEKANQKYEKFGCLTDLIYPPPALTAEEKQKQQEALRKTDVAQPALGAVSLAMLQILQGFGLKPDATCGHSFGELSALCAAGWIDPDTFLDLAIIRGRLMATAGQHKNQDSGAMLAVKAPLDELADLINASLPDVVLANRNSPQQGVLSGPTEAIAKAEQICKQQGFRTFPLPVSAAFHSSLIKDAQEPFKQTLNTIDLSLTDIPVFSNTTGSPYPADSKEATRLLGEHLLRPVDFVSEIENLFTAGVSTFIEVGPKSVLTGLVKSILKDRRFDAIALDNSGGRRFGLTDLATTLAHLAALGHAVDLSCWEQPVPETRKQLMNIPLAGVNYRSEKPAKPQTVKPKTGNQNTMPKKQQKNMALDALKVVQEGLRSMQALQQQTAEIHQKFLETQTEASRTLQNMMADTQRLAEASLGLKPRLDAPGFSADDNLQGLATKQDPPDQTPVRPDAQDTYPLPAEPKIPQTFGEASQAVQTDPKPPEAHKELENSMLEVVSQLTGYPIEMLDPDMDIEADLGIDSIKRVEILSTLEEKMPGLPPVSPEIMGTLKTLGQIIEYLSADKDVQAPAPLEDTAAEPSDSHDQALQQTMLQVVSQLTGYPIEMLALDMDIEADLGIDSIKRVEILSTLEEKIPGLPPVSPEIMGTLKTLGQIIEYLSGTPRSDASQAHIETASATHPESAADHSAEPADQVSGDLFEFSPENLAHQIARRVVTPVPQAFQPGDRAALPANSKVFVFADRSGLSEAIAAEFYGLNFETVLVSQNSLAAFLNGDQELTGAAGLVIVADNQPAHKVSRKQQDFRFLKDAFLLTNRLAPALIDSAAKGGAFLAGISRLDGAFGFKGQSITDPAQGGLAGLVKTAAIEWESVCCRAYDIAPGWQENQKIARTVVNELIQPDLSDPVEIGLDADSRLILKLEDSPYPQGEVNLNPGDVVVITGGAKGVTASAAQALAKRVKPTLILLGRSPRPTPEPQWLDSLEDDAAIKKALLENEFRDTQVTPVQLENLFKQYMSNREISRNLAKMEQAGATVLYYSVDVRNFDQIKSVLDEVRSTHGPITAVIHGAGILEDRLIIDKTIEQFDNVFDPKVKGLNVLLEATKEDALKHLVLFSSITARIGNNGQVDYAMANEVLNKTAQQEALARPDCRVVSINWGPWDGGMVCSALKRKFEQSGVELIPMDAGGLCMLYEMQQDQNSALEVVIGANIISAQEEKIDKPQLAVSHPPPATKPKEKLALTLKREIDIDSYPILQAHILDGKPVVPFALMAEWLGHGALHENPGLVLQGLDDMRIFQGIKLDQEKRLIRLLAGKARKEGSVYKVDVEIRNGLQNNMEMIHSRATAVLIDDLKKPPVFNKSEEIGSKPYLRSMDEVYEKILFHGFALRGIQEIIGLSPCGMVARIAAAPAPAKWMKEPLRSKWIGDPLVLDSAFQMAIIWCFEERSIVSLPSYSAKYRQYRNSFPTDGVTAVLEIRDVSEHKMKGDFTFLDSENVVVARLTGYEAVMDASLSKAFKQRNAA